MPGGIRTCTDHSTIRNLRTRRYLVKPHLVASFNTLLWPWLLTLPPQKVFHRLRFRKAEEFRLLNDLQGWHSET